MDKSCLQFRQHRELYDVLATCLAPTPNDAVIRLIVAYTTEWDGIVAAKSCTVWLSQPHVDAISAICHRQQPNVYIGNGSIRNGFDQTPLYVAVSENATDLV